MNITFKYLEIFNAVVVAGSISRATKPTGMSQPTISQQLAKFEEELGAQLIYRRRGTTLELTPAGEYWYRASTELLQKRDEVATQHVEQFRLDKMVLRFGSTPSLRGSFTEAAATIAVRTSNFSRFEHVWGACSLDIMQMIGTHQINCGVVSLASVESQSAAYQITPLFRENVVWAVPRSVPVSMIEDLLAGGTPSGREAEPFERYVTVETSVPWQERSVGWYRGLLPQATPYFSCMTHQVAVDFVAAGLATCHCPTSLVANLNESVLSRVRLYDLGMFARDAVLAMPRHLMSLRQFSDFQSALSVYARRRFRETYESELVMPLPARPQRTCKTPMERIEHRDASSVSYEPSDP